MAPGCLSMPVSTWPAVPALSLNSWPDYFSGASQGSLCSGMGLAGQACPPSPGPSPPSLSPPLSSSPPLPPPFSPGKAGEDDNTNSIQWNLMELAAQLAAIPSTSPPASLELDTPRTTSSEPIGSGLSLASGRQSALRSHSPATTEETEPGANPRFKTEFCRNFKEQGKCVYGDFCQFAHGTEEMRQIGMHTNYKTKPCRKYWIVGCCPYGPRCNFMHNEGAGGPSLDTASHLHQGRPQGPTASSRGPTAPVRGPQGPLHRPNSRADGIEHRMSPVPLKVAVLGTKMTPPPPLHTLDRPHYGSGRMAAILKEDRYTWIDTFTGIVVYT